jgi:hypothetical protein
MVKENDERHNEQSCLKVMGGMDHECMTAQQ